MNQNAEKKPEAQAEAAIADSVERPCSEAATSDPLRENVIRLVLQLSDTPANRLTMLKAHAAIKSLRAVIEGHGVLKREEIKIVSLEAPAPRPNDPSSATGADTKHDKRRV